MTLQKKNSHPQGVLLNRSANACGMSPTLSILLYSLQLLSWNLQYCVEKLN